MGGLTLSVEEVVEDEKVYKPQELQVFEQFQQLADNVPGMIYQFRLDPDGTSTFPYISLGCQDLYELKPEQVQQQPELLFEMVHADDLPSVQSTMAHSAETLTKWELEWRIITQAGQQKCLKGIARPQLQPDGAILWDGCMIDISEQKAVEAQLQQSQQLLQLVLDNIPQLIFWKDRNSVYQGCNRNFAGVAGVGSPENIVGKTDYDLPWTDEQANRYRQYDQQVMASGQPELHIIETQQQADGRQAWLDTNKIPLQNSQTQVIGILATIEDITTRKQAEETLKRYNKELETRVAERTAQLQQSLQKLMNLKFALNQSAIVSITDIQGNITDANDKFCQISGYSHPELIGVNHSIINSSHHGKQFFQQMWRTIAQGKVWQGEIKNRAKDGSDYWVDTTIVPLLDETKKPYQYISIHYDISDRKQAEMALQYSQAQLQAVLDHAPAAIFLKSLKGEYILVNRELERIFQAPKEELLGKTDYDLFPVEIANSLQENDQQVLKAGQAIHSEEMIQLPDGEHIYEAIKFPISDANGNFYATGGVSIDITSRKAAEDALKQSEARFQRLAANIPGMLYQLRLDTDGSLSFPYVSSGCRDLYEIEPEQLQLDASLLKIHPDDEAEVMAAVAFSAQTLQDWQSEWRIVLPSGEVKWVQAISRPESQADSSTLWNGCLIDISDRKRTEEQLQQFQQRLSLMIEQTPLAVIEWNTQMEITAWNPAAERIFGYAPSEVLGRYMDFILPESAREQVQTVTADLLLQQGGHYSLNTNLRKDGQTIICEWYNTPLVTPNGEVIGVASHALDITERKQAEMQLQQTTAQLQEAQKLAHIGNWNYEIATGEMQWSDQVFRIHGLEDKTAAPAFEELVALYHPQDQKRFQQLMTHTATLGTSYDVELRIVSPDGEVRYVSAKGEGVKNKQGQIIRMFGTLMDITERKVAEVEHQKLISIIEASSDFIGFAATDGTPVYINPAGLKMVGLNSIEEAQTKQAIDFFSTSDAQQFQKKILPKFLVRGTWQGELQLKHFQTGSLIPVDEKLFTVNNPETGEPTGMATIARDITDRKQTEIQLQQQAETLRNTLQELRRTQAQMIQSEKMSSLGQMVAGVAHEINNPISFIHGNLTPAHDYAQDLFELLDLYQQHYPQPPADIQELLEDIELEFLKEDFSKLLKSMKIGTERIRETVLSLRNFSRLDEAEFKRVYIHEGMNSTLMILKSRLPDIEVITEYAQLPKVECYPGQLNQVFMNILDNAIDVLEPIPDHKQIRIQTEAINSDLIRIRIANSGPEISETVRTKVFDPFFTTKPVGQGTGLGLSISYQIISDQHGGNINCHPIPGVGTEFVIEIPVGQTKP